ncbi:hypothetical protein GPECTOR_31g316 [Gonium pectorale]|uniref:Uncharacterized protein n=1 Tax=Gonium pectorale TaxID=33097 RepID=A0A150GDN7_GONPE|nr:hypothetical protein GPECTOR_31g316 [Gonium pectorale]|eukprot:KXZ47954.1 hypothetical protein GPECTOR_31g316 [Gonium pectorale]
MPFTVFTTSHKKTFLKWHAKLTGQGAAAGGAAGPVQQQRFLVYDVTESTISCMTPDGETVDLHVADSDAGTVARVRELFEGGSEVHVHLDEGRKALAGIVQ